MYNTFDVVRRVPAPRAARTTVDRAHGSEQSLVYPHVGQTTLQCLSNVADPHASHVPASATDAAFSRVSIPTRPLVVRVVVVPLPKTRS